MTGSAGQRRIPVHYLANLAVPLPGLDEQRRIAAILDQADELRVKRRAAVAQLDAMGMALFLEMFGDPASNPRRFPKAALGDIINFVGGAQPPKETFTYAESLGSVRLVQIRDFRTDEFKTYIPAKLAKRRFEHDDVMIGRYGPPVFQIFRGLSGSYNVALMKAEPRNVLKVFVFYLLQEPGLHSYVVARSERTAGQSGVNLNLLENYPAYNPPLTLQHQFGAAIEKLDEVHKSQIKAVAAYDALFASLQHRAFAGEL